MKKRLWTTTLVFLTVTMAFAQNFIDVVYLKNGSIIRGIIIEQVPNESLKIQTADDNVFVLKISEVEKMTKERVERTERQTPSTPVSKTVQSARPAQQQNVTTYNVNATEQTPAKNNQFGIKGGLNAANGIFNTPDNQEDGRIGIHLGVFLEVPVSPKVIFQPELVYSMQGDGFKEQGLSFTVSMDYINLPLMFKFDVWQQRLSIDAGLQLGYLTSAKISAAGVSLELSDVVGEELNKLDAAIGFGMSYKLTDKLDLVWRANIGIINVPTNSEENVKNMVFQLGLGYRF